MTQNKFDIFTFQMSSTPVTQLSLFNKPLTREELMEKKNVFFSEIFKSDMSFYHRRFKLSYQVVYSNEDFILLRLANKKVVHIEKQFHRESFESEPSCLIAIYNNPELQLIAVESDRTSFGKSFTVIRIIEKTFEKELQKFDLRIKINPKYEEKEFWDFLDSYEKQVEGLKFEFEYPNLPRVNQYLSDELKEASKSLNSEKTKIEFSAGGNQFLDNLVQSNQELSDLVKSSAEGAGPIKIKIKGYRHWESTEYKVKSFEFDELEVDAAADVVFDYVKAIKNILKNE
jgi:hypothetical protein